MNRTTSCSRIIHKLFTCCSRTGKHSYNLYGIISLIHLKGILICLTFLNNVWNTLFVWIRLANHSIVVLILPQYTIPAYCMCSGSDWTDIVQMFGSGILSSISVLPDLRSGRYLTRTHSPPPPPRHKTDTVALHGRNSFFMFPQGERSVNNFELNDVTKDDDIPGCEIST